PESGGGRAHRGPERRDEHARDRQDRRGGRMSGITKASPQGGLRRGGDEAARVAVQGRGLAIHLCVLLKTARVHDVGNVAFQGPLTNFMDTVEQMWTAEGDFKLQAIGDFLYLNQHRLRVDASSYPSYQYLIDEFKARGLSGFVFT